MTDTAFSNSYIETDAELETMIGADKRASAIALKAAAATDQEWYCQEATRRLDSLPLRGYRYEPKYIENGVQKDLNSDGLKQTLEFPRVIDGVVLEWDHGTDLPIVPDQVKRACLEEAIWILQHNDTCRADNQQSGVLSQTIAGSSETYVPGIGNQKVQSPIARGIVRQYIGSVTR